MLYNLGAFTLADMSSCSAALRALGSNAQSMEEVASKIVAHLWDHLVDPSSGERSCVLVRFYKTHSYGDLDDDLRTFADGLLAGRPPKRCNA